MTIDTQPNRYTSIKIPKRLAEIIVQSPIYKELGYRSVSEFVLSSTRLALERLEKKNAQ